MTFRHVMKWQSIDPEFALFSAQRQSDEVNEKLGAPRVRACLSYPLLFVIGRKKLACSPPCPHE